MQVGTGAIVRSVIQLLQQCRADPTPLHGKPEGMQFFSALIATKNTLKQKIKKNKNFR